MTGILISFPGAGLRGGSGDGTSEGMEARVAVLEAHVRHIQADVTEVKADLKVAIGDVARTRADLATLTERVAHLPSKGFIVTAVLGALAVISALTAFAPAIQHLVGSR